MDTIPRNFFSKEGLTWALNPLGILCTCCTGLFFISLGIELLGMSNPCTLCQYQRWLHFVAALSSGIGLVSKKKQFFLWLGIAAVLASGLVGLYHFLVQAGVVQDYCSIATTPTSKEQFLALLQTKPTACSSLGPALVGIPISLWNFFVSTCIAFFSWKRSKT